MSQGSVHIFLLILLLLLSHLLVQEKRRSSETSEGIPRNLGWTLAHDFDAIAELPVLLFEFGLPPAVQLNTKNTNFRNHNKIITILQY
jgi:hypothetical protein